jgi:hypothetical protein
MDQGTTHPCPHDFWEANGGFFFPSLLLGPTVNFVFLNIWQPSICYLGRYFVDFFLAMIAKQKEENSRVKWSQITGACFHLLASFS